MTSPTTPRDAIGLSEPTAADIIRGWAKAYREGPQALRFPSDPDAEFFPNDMEQAATQLDVLSARVSALQQNDDAMAAQIKTLVGQKTEWMDRAARAEQERDKLQGMLLLCGELGGIGNNETPVTYLRRLIDGLIEAQQERDEALERLKPFANGSIDVSGTAVIVGYPDAEHALKAARDCVRQLKIASGPDKEKKE